VEAPTRRRLRVVTLIERPAAVGGAERIAAEITMRLDPRRFERTLCATREMEGPTLEAELKQADVRVLSLGRRSSVNLAAWVPFYRLLREERIDIVHTHLFGSNVWGTAIGTIARVPVIVAHEHTWSFEGRPVKRLLDRMVVARGADVFLCVSRADRERMIELERIDPARVRFLPNGIPPLPPPSGQDVRKEIGIPSSAPVIGTICGLRPQKALDVLIEATGILRSDIPNLRVLIAGSGPEEGRLRSLIAERGLEGTVIFLGPRRDVPDVLAALDVAVSCSDFEGSPLAVMEYLAAGTPVVATRVGGVPDIIENGVHGLLVDRRDPRGLATSIAELLRDPARRRRMGASGREHQRREFDMGVMVKRIETLYEELHAASRRRSSLWSSSC
jgi:glycosyltransferase involved in cell wall biosynthesis